LKRPQLVPHSSVVKLLQAAEQALQRKDFQQNFELLERARKLDPANPAILLQLGRSHGLRYNYAAAEECFEKAIQLAQNKTQVMAMAALQSWDFFNTGLPERYLRRAVEQKDATANTFARLAELYERLNRNDAATNMVERALHLDKACPLARLTQAKLHRQAGRLVEAEEVLNPILMAADREFRVRGLFERGAICDRLGRYDEAMSAILEAKSLLIPDASPLLAQLESTIKHLNEMRDNVSSEMLARWFDASQVLIQPAHRIALLGGHARSGTTLLEQVLDSHPDIVSADETRIFLDDTYTTLRRNLPEETPMLDGLDAASVETLRLARERYFQSMSLWLGRPPGERLLIDKNPSLQALIVTFVRLFPEARLIVALRDPRDTCLSCFMLPHWPVNARIVSFLTFEGTVSTYTRVMGIWRTLKPLIKNPWLEVRYEDMVEDLEAVARKTLDFLGVSWDAKVLDFHEHARQKPVRSPTYADVARPVFKTAVGRWRNYQKYLEPFLPKLEPFAKAFGYE